MEHGNQSQPKRPQELPNSTLILVLGIGSLVGCCFYGLPGILCSIIALVLSSGAKEIYNEDPAAYTLSSYKNLKAGITCAKIALICSIVIVVLVVVLLLIYGAAIFSSAGFQELLNT